MIKRYSIAIDFNDNDFFTRIYSVFDSLFTLIKANNYNNHLKDTLENLEKLTDVNNKEFLKSQILSLLSFDKTLLEDTFDYQDYFEKTLKQILVNEEVQTFIEGRVKDINTNTYWYNQEFYILDIYVIPDSRFADNYDYRMFHKISVI